VARGERVAHWPEGGKGRQNGPTEGIERFPRGVLQVFPLAPVVFWRSTRVSSGVLQVPPWRYARASLVFPLAQPAGLWAFGPAGLWACGPVGMRACVPMGL
jgi:hypothetical protein